MTEINGPYTALARGAFTIKWYGGTTFEVFMLDRAVNAFTTRKPKTVYEAHAVALDWWDSGGREDTQSVVREGAW